MSIHAYKNLNKDLGTIWDMKMFKNVCDCMVIVISEASRIDEPRKISGQIGYLTFRTDASGNDTVAYSHPRLSIEGKQFSSRGFHPRQH